MKVEGQDVILTLSAPEIFEDPAFIEWLNCESTVVATWHTKGQEIGEYADVLVTYDNGDGCNTDMPEHIWKQICEAVEKAGYGDFYVWVRISNG